MYVTNQDKARYLQHTLPTGIVTDGEYAGDDPRSASLATATQAALLDEGYLCPRVIRAGDNNQPDVTRLVLTPSGVAAALADQDMLTGVPQKISVRGKQNSGEFQRLARIADVTHFIEASGIDTASTAISKGLNPFILGFPLFDNIKYPALYQAVSKARVDWVMAHNYPDYTAQHGPALFLSAIDLPRYYPPKDSRDRDPIRRYNNCLGILIDFVHTTTYYIFHDFNETNIRWYSKAYNSYAVSLSTRLRHIFKESEKWINHPAYPILDSAIIFAPSDNYFDHYVKSIPKMRKPFSHVWGLTFDSAGAYHLQHLLAYGFKDYRKWMQKWVSNNDIVFDLDANGNLLFDDNPVVPCITPEFHSLALDVFLQIQLTGKIPFVACPPHFHRLVKRIIQLAIRTSKYRASIQLIDEDGINVIDYRIVCVVPSRYNVYPLIPDEYFALEYIYHPPERGAYYYPTDY